MVECCHQPLRAAVAEEGFQKQQGPGVMVSPGHNPASSCLCIKNSPVKGHSREPCWGLL